ncbi:uncharacterized protein PHALS_00651 [Plasmopara halstedii]|uniref:Uncharacterized protein n=1 Tax=Plasmopara halstedii TaxID=4781 RepID=A0A0P1B805_PLAHL|nr:uncharacterized protein PHALS_00651 [Plasmopara halstedii]CEG50512.1 hypothetical protein PHALS_00651 [Plasmopara halstedii]|eukprot:XP_024586881.1 hypothetical protein PHALS_00651 [Plasmopara halstedii]
MKTSMKKDESQEEIYGAFFVLDATEYWAQTLVPLAGLIDNDTAGLRHYARQERCGRSSYGEVALRCPLHEVQTFCPFFEAERAELAQSSRRYLGLSTS